MNRIKRIKIKDKIDKKFFCPYCKVDIRERGIDFVENASQSVNASYNDNGSWNNNDYNDTFDSDVVEDSVVCGNCEHELAINPYEDLNLTELWRELEHN